MKLDRVIAVRNRKTVYRNGDKCIKVFNSDYSKAEVLNEALNQARIEDTGLLIPKLLEVTVIDGKWAIVTEHIKGKTLAQLMDEDPDNTDEYLQKLAKLQLDVHSKTCPTLTDLKIKMKERINLAHLKYTTRLALCKTLASMPDHDKVCHGDFTPSNVILSDGGDAYIIDWSHVTRGSGSADAALTYLSLYFDKGADAADKYLDIYCSLSGTAKGYVRAWIPAVAAAKSLKANEKERVFLLSRASVADNFYKI